MSQISCFFRGKKIPNFWEKKKKFRKNLQHFWEKENCQGNFLKVESVSHNFCLVYDVPFIPHKWILICHFFSVFFSKFHNFYFYFFLWLKFNCNIVPLGPLWLRSMWWLYFNAKNENKNNLVVKMWWLNFNCHFDCQELYILKMKSSCHMD